VSCNRSNLPAQEPFEASGFEVSRQVANLIEEGDDEVFYFKRHDGLRTTDTPWARRLARRGHFLSAAAPRVDL